MKDLRGAVKKICNRCCEKDKDFYGHLLDNGCGSGIVEEMIGNNVINFFQEYKQEINQSFSEIIDEYNLSNTSDIFGDEYDETDPLFLKHNNQKLLTWFVFEMNIYKLKLNHEVIKKKENIETKWRHYD